MELDQEKHAKEFHLSVVEAAKRRNEKEKDIEDPAEFERFLRVMEKLGDVAVQSAKDGIEPLLVGRTMHFYAKCIGKTEGVQKGIVPEAAS